MLAAQAGRAIGVGTRHHSGAIRVDLASVWHGSGIGLASISSPAHNRYPLHMQDTHQRLAQPKKIQTPCI